MEFVFRVLGRGLQLLIAFGLVGWVAMAIHFQLAPPVSYIAYGLLGFAALALIYCATKSRWGGVWRWMAITAVAAGVWWSTVDARDDRNWMAEVSRGVTADIADDSITIRNIRNFDWSSETEAKPDWYDVTVDPNKIASVDMFLSVWDHPDIAHTLVSFGFEDGQQVVFSAETRKEIGESFSTLGGFFRLFELVLLAADERDIIRLRTDMRGEQVGLYPIDLTPEQRKILLLTFLEYGNDLAAKPGWYNTLTTNCTTVPYFMVTKFSDKVTLDRRMLLPGRLPEYLHELGVLAKDMSIPDIRERAKLGPQGPGGGDGKQFSRKMRAGWAN